MSGMDEGPPPEVPEEYAAVYRDAYRRALDESTGLDPAPGDDDLIPLVVRPRRPAPARFGPLLLGALVLLGGCVVLGISLLSGSGTPDQPRGSAATGVPSPSPVPSPTEDPGASATPTVTASEVPVWTGAVVPLTLGTGTATCTGTPSVDAAGQPVRYDAANATDGDPSTAWRCDGEAVGERFTVALPDDVEVAELGLIPGYAKTDASSGADRFVENNRVLRVRWTFPGGTSFLQEFDPADRRLQMLRIPPTSARSVTVEILAVDRGSRNRTAISEIAVARRG